MCEWMGGTFVAHVIKIRPVCQQRWFHVASDDHSDMRVAFEKVVIHFEFKHSNFGWISGVQRADQIFRKFVW